MDNRVTELLRRVESGLDVNRAAEILESWGIDPADVGGEFLAAAAQFEAYGSI